MFAIASIPRILVALVSTLTVSLFFSGSTASGFITNGRWTQTALDGQTGPIGTPITLTWGIVPDGTFIPGEGGSSLISFFDNTYGAGPGGADLTQRPWFDLVDSSFGRWEEVSGVTVVYEPADDGANLRGLQGIAGVRADIRVGGAFIDGNGGTLASIGFIPDSDMTIDTGDANHYSNPINDFQNSRNTLSHEFGHALGIDHIVSPSLFLMEPFFNAALSGPQLDDVRAAHQLYGDTFEKGNGTIGNGVFSSATDLGVLGPGDSLLLGDDASTGLFVFLGETDFVSISNQFDNDYFVFETSTASLLDISVTPVGATYEQRPEFGNTFTTIDSSAISDLEFELLTLDNGILTSLEVADATGLGQAEMLTGFALPEAGTYYVRVSGDASEVQMYELALTVEQGGDADGDGDVDVADLAALQRGEAGGLDASGLALWRGGLGAGSAATAALAVPEPAGWVVIGLIATCSVCKRPPRVTLERRSSALSE